MSDLIQAPTQCISSLERVAGSGQNGHASNRAASTAKQLISIPRTCRPLLVPLCMARFVFIVLCVGASDKLRLER